jgi:agmatine/peptidylarginine deiminase
MSMISQTQWQLHRLNKPAYLICQPSRKCINTTANFYHPENAVVMSENVIFVSVESLVHKVIVRPNKNDYG